MRNMLRKLLFLCVALLVAGCTAPLSLLDSSPPAGPLSIRMGIDPDIAPRVAPTVVALLAGQTIDAGTVTVWNDAELLYVRFDLTNGWAIGKSHLATAPTLDGIPQTKKGNPIVGHFPYATDHTPAVTQFLYAIELEDAGYAVGDQILLATHAEALLFDESGSIIGQEGAWADGEDFPWKNWATYFSYTIQSPREARMDAICYYPGNGKFYIFNGDEYVRHTLGSGPDPDYPKKIAGVWSGWPESWGTEGAMDAVAYCISNQKFYIFHEDEFVQHSYCGGPDPGYPKKIGEDWSGWPDSWGTEGHVDCALFLFDSRFRIGVGNHYLVHNLNQMGIYPLMGTLGWPSSWDQVDRHRDAWEWDPVEEKLYIFRDDEFSRTSYASDIDPGFPKKIAEDWSGWPPSWGD
jgi:hypothetical protein